MNGSELSCGQEHVISDVVEVETKDLKGVAENVVVSKKVDKDRKKSIDAKSLLRARAIKEVQEMMRRDAGSFMSLAFSLSPNFKKMSRKVSSQKTTLHVIGKECPSAGKVERFGDLRKFRIVRVVDPTEFYMIRDKDVVSAVVEDNSMLYEEFQKVMTENEKKFFSNEFTVYLSLRMCYAYYDDQLEKWCRVRLLETFPDCAMKIGRAYFVDVGMMRCVRLTALRTLPDKFTSPARPIFKFCLYDVISNVPNGRSEWTKEAVEYFMELITRKTNAKTLYALPITWTVEESNKRNPDARYELGVVLFTVASPSKKLSSVNWKIMEEGYANSNSSPIQARNF